MQGIVMGTNIMKYPVPNLSINQASFIIASTTLNRILSILTKG